jgi:hypothetical protein
MNNVQVQIIPMGKTANLTPNKWFSIVSDGHRKRKEYEQRIAKTLPRSKRR